MAMVAIKADGGTPAEAKQYLKSHGADLSKWIVASDTGGTYYQRANGTNALWGYALVDDSGHLIERGHAGSYYVKPGAQEFVLAGINPKQKDPGAAPFVQIDESTPPELKPVAHVAELGRTALALRALKGWERGKTKDAAARIKTALLDRLAARVQKASDDLKSEDPEARYDAYRYLQSVSGLTDTPAGQTAKAALATLKTDKDLAKDLTNQTHAEAAFWSLIVRAERLEVDQRKAQLPVALQQFATTFAGTSYAERASNEAEIIASGQLAQ